MLFDDDIIVLNLCLVMCNVVDDTVDTNKKLGYDRSDRVITIQLLRKVETQSVSCLEEN